MACRYHLDRSAVMPNYYSECINVVKRHITDAMGYAIIEFDENLPRSEEEAVFGRIDYEKKTISINCFCAGCALLTYLHEAGHALHYALAGSAVAGGVISVENRERWADFYAREISNNLGFQLEEEWLKWTEEVKECKMSNTDAVCKRCGSGYWRPECEELNDTGYCTDACYIAYLKALVEELKEIVVNTSKEHDSLCFCPCCAEVHREYVEAKE